jgi:hypothetical protein
MGIPEMNLFEVFWDRYETIRQQLIESGPREGPTLQNNEAVDKLRRECDVIKETVLGHPESFKKIRCWMIDVKGMSAECDVSEKLVMDCEEDAIRHFGHKYIEQFGALPSEVREVMAMWNLTDSGGGGGCWYLGCHCTEEEAKNLCTELYHRFHHAIERGLLIVERKPWSLKLAE